MQMLLQRRDQGKEAGAVLCESQERVQSWVYVGKAIARMMGLKGMVLEPLFWLTRGVSLWIPLREPNGSRSKGG